MKAQPHIQKAIVELAKQTGTIQTTKGRQDQLPVNFGLFQIDTRQVSILDELETVVTVQQADRPQVLAESIPQYKLTKENSTAISEQLTGPSHVAEYLRQFFESDIEIYESFFILLLNRSNRVTGWVKLSQGGIAGTVVDLLILAKYVVDSLAKNVIMCHNHPSGNTRPSEQDRQMTAKVKDMLKLFDVTLMDHVILTADDYFSFSNEGIL